MLELTGFCSIQTGKVLEKFILGRERGWCIFHVSRKFRSLAIEKHG